MTIESAGLLLYRRHEGAAEVLLGHMGGPFWARKDLGAWSIPKGEIEPGEEPLDCALREFTEELGLPAPHGPYTELGTIRQSRKIVHVWAVEHDLDPSTIEPGTFTMTWPPKSGREQDFPEIERVAWFSPDEAYERIVAGQRELLDRWAQSVPH
ncbi:hypothetical protein BHE97_18935 [Aeromicrobium sp. PE09-221]|uniref:NUDIX domain-containing protein n=1 Tax=Aeromicrobium sp. PE09-221 TaxID=1898043 RepID=UPI000B3E5079|nr:NUDIX domain-containing protein [Aeromicrobium sp. PE09-221]OUZ06461.1 hypothetical protein BHE97_18935 [Aeromicrobium sp. PE09-221]